MPIVNPMVIPRHAICRGEYPLGLAENAFLPNAPKMILNKTTIILMAPRHNIKDM